MAKLFESDDDLKREKKAIEFFLKKKYTCEKLDRFDIDYKIYDENKNIVGYVEVKGRNKIIEQAYELPIAKRKIDKLISKNSSAIVVWACEDGIIYGNIKDLEATFKFGGRTPRQGSANDLEWMFYYKKQEGLTEKYYAK
jgi:hypothetical protein